MIADKMICRAASLHIGYLNPFKPRGSGKPIPSSLENEEEWRGLIQHVKSYREAQKAKNRGKGVIKDFVITIVDLGDETESKVRVITFLSSCIVAESHAGKDIKGHQRQEYGRTQT